MGWNVELPPAEYYTLASGPKLDALVREITAQKAVAIDTETDGLNLWKCIVHYWSMSWEDGGREKRITLDAATLPRFKEAFADTGKQWIFANAKFDMHMLANVGINFAGKCIDTSVMHALLYEEMPHGLKEMAKHLLGWKWTDFSDTFGKTKSGYCICGSTKTAHKDGGFCKKTGCPQFHQITPLHVLREAERTNPKLLIEYAANDAYGTWKLYKKLHDQLTAEHTFSLYPNSYPYIKTVADYFYKIEMPFTKVLYTCERNGMKVDRQYLVDISPKIQQQIADLRKAIVQEVGYMINPASDHQLREYFFGKLGLKPKRFTKGGKTGVKQPSVDAKFLESIEDDVKAAALILELSKIEKQYGTYIEEMPNKLDPNDRVHMRLNQDVARTGRLSSSGPNMQNVTTGEKDIFGLRKAFIADQDCDLVVADYSQLEMRLLAAASMEERMCDIFRRNWDIHMGNASMVFGIPYEDMQKAKKADKLAKAGKSLEDATAEVFQLDGTANVKEMVDYVHRCMKARNDVKTIGFGLNYGMKEKSLARRMGCNVEEAIAKMDQYMAAYPAVRKFFEDAVQEVRETGYAFTLLGRRRRLNDIWATSSYDRFRAERQASNLPIQGTAADVCKMAMILIHEDNLQQKYDCRMQLQVHDEIVFQCPKKATQEVIPIIKQWMEHPFPTDLAVALDVEIGSGHSWGEAK
jgi:DNA polymerase-1